MKRTIIIFISILIAFGILYPQNPGPLDEAELEKQLKESVGKDKIPILNRLAVFNFYRSPKKIIKYGEQGLKLSRKYNDRKGEASALRNISIGYWTLGKHAEALEYCREALKIFKEIKHTTGTVMSLSTIGTIYGQLGDNAKALEHLLQGLEIAEKSGEDIDITALLNNTGMAYKDMERFPKALEYFERALEIDTKSGNKSNVAFGLYNIGTVYAKQNNNKKALEYFLKALKIRKEIGENASIAGTLLAIGINYHLQDNLTPALEYMTRALKKCEEIGGKESVALALAHIGSVQTKLKKYDEARSNLERGLKIAREIQNKGAIKEIYKSFTGLFSAKADYKNAFHYQNLYHEVETELLFKENNQQFNLLQVRYETLQKEKEVIRLKKDNEIQEWTRNTLIAVIGLGLIIMGLLFKKFVYLFSFWKKEKHIGQYRLIDEIGAGGMGTVYRAHGIRNKNETAAVKVMKQEPGGYDSSRDRFMREADIIAKLEHPHIVKIFERGEYQNKTYIAMELLEGKTLDAWIMEKGTEKGTEKGIPDTNVCFHIMLQIIDALSFIHEKAVIHRDLNPSNIMLIENEGDPYYVKLLDFGLAKTTNQTKLTRTGILIGTINYMPPEQLNDSRTSAAGDVYSMGATFYEMLSGKLLFYGDSPTDIMRQIIGTTPIGLERLRPGIPGELSNLIMKMLEKEPGARPAPGDAQRELETIRRGLQQN